MTLRNFDVTAKETRTYFDSLNLLFNIDELIKHLEYIEEAIDLARQSIPSSRLISYQEMKTAKQILLRSGLETTIVENVLDISSAYVMYSKETIIYILKIPKIKNAEYTMNFVESIISNQTRIHLTSTYYLNGPIVYSTKSQCPKYKHIYICPSSQLEPVVECVQQIIKGENAQCPTERVYNSKTIRKINEGNILVNDANVVLTSNCSNHQRELKGTFLIQFSSCMLKLDGEEFSNSNLEISAKSFIPTTGVKKISTGTSKLLDGYHLAAYHLYL
ncbi:uncharacterized protein LOC131439016 [Malaya genurostris]|nr:uncharacterized protein LOC131439016 [Malaya genurostris]